MKFQVIYRQGSGTARSPVRIIEQPAGREIGWVNRFLDRRRASTTLRHSDMEFSEYPRLSFWVC